VGLRGHDPDRAFAGFTLFSPLPSNNKTIYLIDMHGNVVHTWQMPYPPSQSGYLTDRGTLFYNGQIPNDAMSATPLPRRLGTGNDLGWPHPLGGEAPRPQSRRHPPAQWQRVVICQKPALPDTGPPAC
jgi:hypothetical protein